METLRRWTPRRAASLCTGCAGSSTSPSAGTSPQVPTSGRPEARTAGTMASSSSAVAIPCPRNAGCTEIPTSTASRFSFCGRYTPALATIDSPPSTVSATATQVCRCQYGVDSSPTRVCSTDCGSTAPKASRSQASDSAASCSSSMPELGSTGRTMKSMATAHHVGCAHVEGFSGSVGGRCGTPEGPGRVGERQVWDTRWPGWACGRIGPPDDPGEPGQRAEQGTRRSGRAARSRPVPHHGRLPCGRATT